MSEATGNLAQRGVLLLFLGIVFLLSATRLASDDLFWHLRIGEEIAETRAVVTTDRYSFTAAGKHYPPTTWLFDLGLHLCHRIGGFPFLSLVQGGIVTAIFAILFWIARRRGVGSFAAIWLLLLLFFLARFRFHLRPHLLSDLFFVGLFLLWELSDRKRHWPLYLIVPLVWIWANAYAGVYFGIGLLGGLFGFEFLSPRRGIPRRTLVVVGAMSLLVTFLTPSGTESLTHILAHRNIYREIPISEHAPNAPGRFPLFWTYGGIVLLLVATSFRTIHPGEAFLILLFGLLAAARVRMIPMFCWVSLPPLSAILARHTACLPLVADDPRQRVRLRRLTTIWMAVCLLAVASIARRQLPWHDPRWRPGLGVHPHLFPEDALDFMLRNGITGRIYNSYDFGGYVLWRAFPDIEVFYDGRSFLHLDLIRRIRRETLRGVVDAEGIDVALVKFPRRGSFEDPTRAFEHFFLHDPEWALVYFDDIALLFLRRTPEWAGWIAAHEDRSLHPATLSFERGDPAVPAELDRAVSRTRCSAVAHLLRARYFQRSNPARSIHDLAAGLVCDPYNGVLLNDLGVLRLQGGETAEACTLFEAAHRADRQALSPRINLALCDLAVGDIEGAKERLRKIVARAPTQPLALYHLARLLAESGDPDAPRFLHQALAHIKDPDLRRELENLLSKSPPG